MVIIYNKDNNIIYCSILSNLNNKNLIRIADYKEQYGESIDFSEIDDFDNSVVGCSVKIFDGIVKSIYNKDSVIYEISDEKLKEKIDKKNKKNYDINTKKFPYVNSSVNIDHFLSLLKKYTPNGNLDFFILHLSLDIFSL
jgi:hypothetical protein